MILLQMMSLRDADNVTYLPYESPGLNSGPAYHVSDDRCHGSQSVVPVECVYARALLLLHRLWPGVGHAGCAFVHGRAGEFQVL